jgi:hypothetical protein
MVHDRGGCVGKWTVERQDDAICVGFTGVGDGADIAAVHAEVQRLQAQRLARFLVADTTLTRDYDLNVRGPSVAFLDEMKQRDWFELVVVIAPSSLVRMMASALGMAAGVRLRCVADKAGADALLSQRRAA